MKRKKTKAKRRNNRKVIEEGLPILKKPSEQNIIKEKSIDFVKSLVNKTWKIVLIIGSVLALTSYDFFMPKVEFIAKESLNDKKPLSVPIEIRNNSRFEITDVESVMVIDSFVSDGVILADMGFSWGENKVKRIGPNQSYEYYENSTSINPIGGVNAKTYLRFNLSYTYLGIKIEDTLRYKFAYDNNKVIWMKRPN